ncbi:MAG: Hsp20/alpha crystallin family protein [Anaerolineaceae bacterium]|nr:Hsp20/alpha crystallin family protein [Anaerolineaceae bacterium]
MEIKIEKANGQPLTSKDAEILFNYLKNKFEPFENENAEYDDCKFSKGPHEVEVFIAEDDTFVYAAALCPGISKDRIEVFIDGDELFIESKPANDGKKDNNEGKPFLWKCIESISYVGECELPTEVIAEEATAELANGVLYILLPKSEAEKPKSVPVI